MIVTDEMVERASTEFAGRGYTFFFADLRAALEAALSGVVGAGDYVLVPKEPTEAMLEATSSGRAEYGGPHKEAVRNLNRICDRNTYRAMLAAAPPAPSPDALTMAEIETRLRDAYGEGFIEGMNEYQKPRTGGKTWPESRAFAALAALRNGREG